MDSRILSNSHNASVKIFPIFTHGKQGDFQANRIRPNLICSCFETGLLENLVEEFLSKPIRKKVERFCGMWGWLARRVRCWLARRVAGICARSWLLMLTIFPLHYGVILLWRREVFVGRLVGYLFVKGINHLIYVRKSKLVSVASRKWSRQELSEIHDWIHDWILSGLKIHDCSSEEEQDLRKTYHIYIICICIYI